MGCLNSKNVVGVVEPGVTGSNGNGPDKEVSTNGAPLGKKDSLESARSRDSGYNGVNTDATRPQQTTTTDVTKLVNDDRDGKPDNQFQRPLPPLPFLLERSHTKTTFGESFLLQDDEAWMKATPRRKLPRRLEKLKTTKPELTREEIDEKLERAQQRKKEQELFRLERSKSFHRGDPDSVRKALEENIKQLEMAIVQKEEAAAEKRRQQMMEAREKQLAREGYAASVRQRRLEQGNSEGKTMEIELKMSNEESLKRDAETVSKDDVVNPSKDAEADESGEDEVDDGNEKTSNNDGNEFNELRTSSLTVGRAAVLVDKKSFQGDGTSNDDEEDSNGVKLDSEDGEDASGLKEKASIDNEKADNMSDSERGTNIDTFKTTNTQHGEKDNTRDTSNDDDDKDENDPDDDDSDNDEASNDNNNLLGGYDMALYVDKEASSDDDSTVNADDAASKDDDDALSVDKTAFDADDKTSDADDEANHYASKHDTKASNADGKTSGANDRVSNAGDDKISHNSDDDDSFFFDR